MKKRIVINIWVSVARLPAGLPVACGHNCHQLGLI